MKDASTLPSQSRGSNKLVLILNLINFFLTLGIGGAVFYSFFKEKKQAKFEDLPSVQQALEMSTLDSASPSSEVVKKVGKFIDLKQFKLNLAHSGFAIVNISVEVPTDDVEVELNSKIPMVRDILIHTFATKTKGDLDTIEKRENLKESIKGVINSFLISGKVKGVYFTNFALSE